MERTSYCHVEKLRYTYRFARQLSGAAANRITSYNVCYTKLLRLRRGGRHGDETRAGLPGAGRISVITSYSIHYTKLYEKVAVSSQTPGILDEVLVERGDTVEPGQVLARLKSGVEKAA